MNQIQIDITLEYVPENKDGFTTTQAHFNASTKIDVDGVKVAITAPHHNQFSAEHELRERVAKLISEDIKYYDVEIRRTIFTGPAEFVQKHFEADWDEATRENVAKEKVLKEKAKTAELKIQIASHLQDIPGGAELVYIDHYGTKGTCLEVRGVRRHNSYSHRQENVIKAKKFYVNTKKGINWNKVKDAVAVVSNYNARVKQANEDSAQKKEKAVTLRKSLGILAGSKMFSENTDGSISLKIKIMTKEDGQKIIRALQDAGISLV